MTPPTLQLLPVHPGRTSMTAIASVWAGIRVTERLVDLQYVLVDARDRLRLPAEASARRCDGLWQHTCVEAFLGVPGGEAYLELNLAPSGDWALYAFARYRERGPSPETDAPKIRTTWRERDLVIDARIARDRWPVAFRSGFLRVGLSVVTEGLTGALDYYALAHPREVPDFHDARAHFAEWGILSNGTSP